ncbi:MAG: ABC transporter permease subunit [Planctomycetota bacterium]
MNRGLLIKSIREVWLATAICGLAFAVFEALLAYAIPIFYTELGNQWADLRFVQSFFKGLLGAEAPGIGPIAGTSVAWVHPMILALVGAHVIFLCTRVPADEVDRGTIDVLLALPLSRTRVYLGESVVWLGAGLLVIVMGLVGTLLGGSLVGPEHRPDLGALIIVAVNMYFLYLSVGGFTCMVSSLSNRRGRAFSVVFAIVLVSFMVNFLAQLWGPAKSLAFLSVLDYYQPLFILRSSSWPLADMLTLLTVGVVFWLAGMLIFARRDICTV